MVLDWFSWIFKVVSWFLMVLGWFSWLFKVFHGSWLAFMVFKDSFMIIHGSWLVLMFFKEVSRFFMVLGWFSWLFKVFVVFHGSWLAFMVFQGFGQLFLVVYWLCMNDQILFQFYISGPNCLRVVMCPLKTPRKRAETILTSYSVIRTTNLVRKKSKNQNNCILASRSHLLGLAGHRLTLA